MHAPEIRLASPDDIGAAIAVAGAALGWNPADPNDALFRWKHLDNPAGVSPMWLAVDGDAVTGFRTMLRWTFTADGVAHRAVRAVDTATHPDHVRKGIFRALTVAAVDALTADGVDFVFNTPNDQSRPGYLRMGWVDTGRLPVKVAVRTPGSLARLTRARTPATKWSEPVTGGHDIEAVADDLPDLLARLPLAQGLTTWRTVDHLRWRYGFAPLHYRAIRDDEGIAIVRVRRRGPAREIVLAEMLAPDRRVARRLDATIRRTFAGDHLLALSRSPHPLPRMLTAPGLGPHLTLRDLASTAPSPDRLRLSLGDVELF